MSHLRSNILALKRSCRISADKKQKSRQKVPDSNEEEAGNEIMDLSDPEKITKERGGWWRHKGLQCFTLPQV